MIFVDTNVLIDIVAPDQQWRDWSLERVQQLAGEDMLVVNQIVLAELASGFPSFEEAAGWLGRMGIEIRILDEQAAFVGGLAFRRYRRAGRDRTSILSDFLIAGHAAWMEARLLTRDIPIYRRYFPDLSLITPETHP